MSSGDWCTTTAFHQSSLPSSNNFTKMPPVKWSTTGNWRNLSAYKPASVRAVCSPRRSSWWWSTGLWGSPQQVRGRASSGPSRNSWRTWTSQTTSAFSPTSSKMHRRSFVGLQQKLRRLDSRSTLGRPRPWELTTNRMIHCDYTRRTSRRLTSLSTWAKSKDGGTDEDIKCRIKKPDMPSTPWDQSGDQLLSHFAIRLGSSTPMWSRSYSTVRKRGV